MPSCTLTSISTLLTPDGWIRTDRRLPSGRALGVDRHGALTVQDISIQVSNTATDICFVGTRATFGAFHPDSLIVDSSGVLQPVRMMVEADTLASLQFESAVESDEVFNTDAACTQIWSELSAICLTENEVESLFYVLDHTSSDKSKPPHWMTNHISGKRRYVSVRRLPFLSELRTKGTSALFDMLRRVRSTAAGFVEVECRNYPLILWLLTHLHREKINCRLAFDSLQHSSVAALDFQQNCGAIEQARTAFIAGVAQTATVVWEERLWNPISSGFVAAGR
jgi:hypothetical protein